MTPPKDLADFLPWFRDQTERAWAEFETRTFEQYQQCGIGGTSWQRGTRWTDGMSDDEIAAVEDKWNLRFPPDYRLFLSMLGATDRPTVGAMYKDDQGMAPVERPGFYNWQTDDAALTDMLVWPVEGILFDVEASDLWSTSWGERPQREEDRKAIVEAAVKVAPALIPITEHRYLLGEPVEAGNPVLSVYQSDIIVYGGALRDFLVTEIRDLIGLGRNGADAELVSSFTEQDLKAIPFWGELIE